MQSAPTDIVAGLPIWRIVAPNPSALTGNGTNTWIFGHRALTVIDPGPALPAHLDTILSRLRPDQHIAQIIVTHAHLDHSALCPDLSKRTGAPVLAFGDAGAGRSPLMQDLVAAGYREGGEGADTTFAPDRIITDGQALPLPDTDLSFEVLHTPGHMGGHICLALGDRLFSGDHVMGWSTTLVSPPDGDMGAYMQSLHRLSQRRWARFLPGHGDPVEDPPARLAELIRHRLARESAILDALQQQPACATTLATRIYTDIPPHLHAAASRNILAHLIDLESKNRIRAEAPAALDTIYHHN